MVRRFGGCWSAILLVAVATANSFAADLTVGEWLALGPEPFEREADPFDTTPPPALLSAIPDSGETVTGLAWQSIASDDRGQADLIGRGFDPEEIACAYLHAYVWSPDERGVTLSVGSDDGIQIFVNGTEIHRNWVLRGWNPDQESLTARLGAGWNRLLVRVANLTGGFAGSVRIVEGDGLRVQAAKPADYKPTGSAPFVEFVETRLQETLTPGRKGKLVFHLSVTVRNLGTREARKATLGASTDDGTIEARLKVDVSPGASDLVIALDAAAVGRAAITGTGLTLEFRQRGGDAREATVELGAREVLRILTADPPLHPDFEVAAADVAKMLENWHWGERFRPDLFEEGDAAFLAALDAYLRQDRAAFDAGWGELVRRVAAGAAEIKKQRITFVGNSHIDMAWLWDRDETIEVVEMTYDQALKFVDEFPFFNYAQSQMQTYDWVESLFPEMDRQMTAAIAARRFMPVGGMWVEADCNLPSGESFVRQLLYGKGYVRDRYGIDIKVGWNPDSFGYAATLPMIFKGAGIDYFITQKIGWNDTTEFPHRLFWWQAPDGSKVLTYFPFTYVDDARPENMALRMQLQQEQQPGLVDMLNLYGVGDHGGGPTREMIERYVEMSEIATFPAVEHAHPREFLERVEKKYAGEIPVWDDELYLEYHRGTFTTQGEMKLRNRKMESRLESGEKFASIAAALVGDYDYPDEQLDGAWLRTLFNQFHDILPGSAIPEVYADARADYDAAESAIESATESALDALTGLIATDAREGLPVVVFNPLSWTRSEVVSISGGDLPFSIHSASVVDARGNPVLTQPVFGRLLFAAGDVPGIGYRTFWITDSAQQVASAVRVDFEEGKATVENEHLRAVIDPYTGDLASLIQVESGREMLRQEVGGNVLQLLVDLPDQWDAWNIGYTGELQRSDLPAETMLLEGGPARVKIRTTRTIGDSLVIHDYVLATGSPVLEIETQVDWNEDHKFLKSAFFLTADGDVATYEIPYGTIERKTRPTTEAGKAKWEVPGHRWVDLTDRSGDFGITLLNDSKYGHDLQGTTLRLSLLRAPKYPDPQADIGKHRFTYALYPHQGGWRQAKSYRHGAALNLPLVARRLAAGSPGSLPPEGAWLTTGADHVVLSALKATRDVRSRPAFVLRVHEVEGRKGTVPLRFPFPVAEAYLVNLMEDRETKLEPRGNTVEIPIGANELKSVLVRPGR